MAFIEVAIWFYLNNFYISNMKMDNVWWSLQL